MAAEEAAWDVDAGQILRVLLRRRWIILSCLALGAAVAASYVLTAVPVYRATALVLIEKERSQSDGVRVESSAEDYYQTQYRILKSRALLKQVHADMNLQNVAGFSGPGGPDRLGAMISISPVSRSRLVNISAESPHPEFAARVANALADRYVSQNIENKLFISKDIIQTLYPKGQPFTSEEQDRRFSMLPTVVNNPLIQQLRSMDINLEAQLGQASRRYTRDHPQMKRLEHERAVLLERLRLETLRVVEGMKAELSGQLLGNNVRVVDQAEIPKAPAKPDKRRIMLIASLMGLLIGCVLAVVVDTIDQRIYSQEDVEAKLGLPFLGSVPKAAMESGDIIQDYGQLITGPESLTGESLKNIRTMIGFAAAGKEMKHLLVTSSAQGEGKTFIAINLASTFAHLGEKVLLIEGDLRRPNLHRRLGLSNEKGLSHFLAHSRDVADLPGFVQETVLPNLRVLVSGPIPPNPAELLSTPKVKALLTWAGQNYDHVFVDGTPVFPITDALLWGNHVDAAVFVVKFGAVHSQLASRARKKLQEGGLKIAGAIVNHVTWKSHSYYYYGDYYYHYYSSYYHDRDGSSKSKGKASKAAGKAA